MDGNSAVRDEHQGYTGERAEHPTLVRLTRLTPIDLTNEPWMTLVSPAVEQVLPVSQKDNLEAYQRFLATAICGGLLVYLINDQEGEVLGVIILGITTEPVTNRKMCGIWSLYTPEEHVSIDVWKLAWLELEKLAFDWGCATICAYTDVPRVDEILQAVGAKEEARYYIKEL